MECIQPSPMALARREVPPALEQEELPEVQSQGQAVEPHRIRCWKMRNQLHREPEAGTQGHTSCTWTGTPEPEVEREPEARMISLPPSF